MIPPRIKDVSALDNYELRIIYLTGEIRVYDMKKLLNYNFYQKLNNKEYFKLVKSVETTIEWPDGEDVDPNELYENSIISKE